MDRTGRTSLTLLLLLSLGLLSGCATHTAYRAHRGTSYASPGRYYPRPGPAGDPWGPYIREAAGRYGLPERWIREVMRRESGGQAQAVSWVGAMGLMQVMPDTYEGLRERYSLGDDPYDPHNNILAGAAYIKEMYDRYGSPGFLAAYNAGPNRLDAYLSGSRSLPNETVNYLAAIAPRLGDSPAMTGPLAAYAIGGSRPTMLASAAVSVPYLSTLSSSAGCDADAAYDPTQPCRPAPVQVAATPPPPAVDCDPDAAYDPSVRCKPAPAVILAALPEPPPPARAPQPAGWSGRSAIYAPPPAPAAQSIFAVQTAAAAELPRAPAIPAAVTGAWAIQVGAFPSSGLARAVAAAARDEAPNQLRAAQLVTPSVTPPGGGGVLYRARLTQLSVGAATSACARLAQRQLDCVVIPPGQAW